MRGWYSCAARRVVSTSALTGHLDATKMALLGTTFLPFRRRMTGSSPESASITPQQEFQHHWLALPTRDPLGPYRASLTPDSRSWMEARVLDSLPHNRRFASASSIMELIIDDHDFPSIGRSRVTDASNAALAQQCTNRWCIPEL